MGRTVCKRLCKYYVRGLNFGLYRITCEVLNLLFGQSAGYSHRGWAIFWFLLRGSKVQSSVSTFAVPAVSIAIASYRQ